MPPSYLDFHIDISPENDGLHEIVARSQAGDQRAFVKFPLIDHELELYLTKLENAILRSNNRSRRTLTPEEQAVQTFGRHLFDFLFAEEIRPLFRQCQTMADSQQCGVRLKLNLRTPHLAALPWEFLFDAARRDYLCLDPNTPLVRYSELAQPTAPLRVEAPLRILGMIAEPSDLRPLDTEHEKQRIEEALAPLQKSGQLELTWVDGQSSFDLQRALRRGPWHIFHFVGHGGFDEQRDEGFLALVGDDGYSDRLYASQLARLLRMQRSTLRLALLNACDGARASNLDIFSSTAATLLGDGLPAVLAMQYEISNNAAKQFSQTFYEALADNLPIDTAVADARNAINLRDRLSLEWGTPVLYMRASDGHLFDLAREKTRQGEKVQPQSAPSGEVKEPKPVEKRSVEIVTPKPATPPKAQPIWQQIGIEMIKIPAGEFLYGDDKQKVNLPEFWIAKTPVTNQQYKAFVDSTGHLSPKHWKDGKIPAGKEQHPVVNVSWNEVEAFCKWAEVQLPTEMQWEKAARGTNGRTYPWGDEKPDRSLCNYKNSEKRTTTWVGKYSKGESPYGLLDMAGNVWEWCSDWYDDEKTMRVLRGGSYEDNETFIRCAYRNYFAADGLGHNGGFRVAYVDSNMIQLSSPNAVLLPKKTKATSKRIPKVTISPAITTTQDESDKKIPIWQQIGIEMIKIPAGDFLYGDDKRKITLPEFWIAKTPVTNQQYKAFVDATGHRLPRHWENGKIPNGKESHPVVNVSWDDAKAFCKWTDVELPSEQQWEKAARGTDGREFPWGNEEPDRNRCNFNDNEKGTTPVGKYPAGANGLYDMAGNVWEWCEDWYDNAKNSRVVRGGAFVSPRLSCVVPTVAGTFRAPIGATSGFG